MRRIAMIGLLALGALCAHARAASACQCSTLRNELRAGSGVVPENARGIFWWFRHSIEVEDLSELVTLERWGDGGLQEVPAEVIPVAAESFVVGPVEPWSVGERYRLEVDIGEKLSSTYADLRFAVVEVEIVEAVPKSVVSTLLVQQPAFGDLLVEDGASCSTLESSAYVDVIMRTDGFGGHVSVDLFHFSTIVDDEAWRPQTDACLPVEPGTSWLYRAGDRIAASCTGNYRTLLEPGEHRVRMEARLPGTDIVYVTDEVSVNLECPTQSGADAGGSEAEGRDASAPDGAESDSGAQPSDAPTQERPDAGQPDASVATEGRDAGNPSPPRASAAETRRSGGCALSPASPPASGTSALWLLVLAAIVAGRMADLRHDRSRRRRPGPCSS